MALVRTSAPSRGARAAVLRTLDRAPAPLRGWLGRGLLAGYRSLLAYQGRSQMRTGPPNGLPMPPAHLRVLVGLDLVLDPDDFLKEGQRQAGFIREMIDRVMPMADSNAVLDFGCGCGRLARWFADLEGPELHGCDYDRRLVEWCDENLGFLRVTTNNAAPPLTYVRDSFDAIYALSVLTHMPEALERAWMTEFRRVLRPGGVLWFSVMGDWYRTKIPPEQLAAYDRGERVTRFGELPGTNLCAAWHPPSFVRRLLSETCFELVECVPGSDEPLAHDAYLVRTPS
jgi:SAM-dependent methyltransferase